MHSHASVPRGYGADVAARFWRGPEAVTGPVDPRLSGLSPETVYCDDCKRPRPEGEEWERDSTGRWLFCDWCWQYRLDNEVTG